MKDNIFSDSCEDGFSFTNNKIPKFAFNEKVAAVFDDMIIRSVPGYALSQYLSSKIAHEIVKNNTNIYDLGCSTATSLLKIYQDLSKTNLNISSVNFIGIDSSADMLKKAREKLDSFSLSSEIKLLEDDIRIIKMENASFIMSHYTLQFISPNDRLELLKNAYNALNNNCCFILSEKIKHSSQITENIITHEYYEFKKSNGYSENENIKKRQALENVLIPNTLEENINLLELAGFNSIEILHKELSFSTLLAWKIN